MVRILSSVAFVMGSFALIAVANPMSSSCGPLDLVASAADTAVDVLAKAIADATNTIKSKCTDPQAVVGALLSCIPAANTAATALDAVTTTCACHPSNPLGSLVSMRALCNKATANAQALSNLSNCIKNVDPKALPALRVTLCRISGSSSSCFVAYAENLTGATAAEFNKCSVDVRSNIDNLLKQSQGLLLLSFSIDNHLDRPSSSSLAAFLSFRLVPFL
ncbi:hypothetical protein C8J56DRAFT_1063122 [Mycena floridula]|nr:hypothetical protein C8J56DRAFT_1063122 [Mycena floridula]